MKQKTASFFFFFLFLVALQAQESVVAASGQATGNGGSSSFTVGQLITDIAIGANGSLSSGVQQAFEISATLGLEITEINLILKAYPNPTINNLTLDIGNYSNENLSFQLFDFNGKELKKEPITNNRTTIDMYKFSKAVYLLNIYHKNSVLKTFRILKN